MKKTFPQYVTFAQAVIVLAVFATLSTMACKSGDTTILKQAALGLNLQGLT
jgi:hypothetical protein